MRLLSIRELAQRAGVAPSTIYLVENGRTTPQPGVIRRLAVALDLPANAIEEFSQAIEARKVPRRSRYR